MTAFRHAENVDLPSSAALADELRAIVEQSEDPHGPLPANVIEEHARTAISIMRDHAKKRELQCFFLMECSKTDAHRREIVAYFGRLGLLVAPRDDRGKKHLFEASWGPAPTQPTPPMADPPTSPRRPWWAFWSRRSAC